MAEGRPSFWTSGLLAAEPGLAHGMTRRGLNMAMTVGADVDGTVARRREVCHGLSLPYERLTVGQQVHGAGIAVVAGTRVGAGRGDGADRIPNADGLVTDEPGVALMALGADCCLVVVYDPVGRAVGVAHAGWRGTARGVVESLLRHMTLLFSCRAETLLAAVAPCVGVCCYEVREDVVSTFAAGGRDTSSIVDIRGGAMYLDLAGANVMQLRAGGLDARRIDVSGVCTICDASYYSHRRAPGAGQGALIAGLLPTR